MTSAAATGIAYGKLILLGEHAVVYGTPALVLGIGLEVRATASVHADGPTQLRLLERSCQPDIDSADALARAFAALLGEGGAPAGVQLTVEAELPPGMGLGFSGAAAVAIARALEGLAGEVDPARVRERATAWERVYHGNPSGVDVAAAMHGGCIRYVRGEPIQHVRVGDPMVLCVGLTGVSGSTRDMVAGVARIRQTDPALHQKSIDAIAAVVDNGISALEAGDLPALGELMNLNQMLLAGLMVSTHTLEQLCATARDAGALGAKLTGGGGGGAMVALAGSGDDGAAIAEQVVSAWKREGFQGFITSVGQAHTDQQAHTDPKERK